MRTCLERWAGVAILLGVMFLGLSACGDDGGEGPTGRVSVQQIFRPEQPYGVEGSISSVVIERDGAELLRNDVAHAKIDRAQTLLDDRLEPGAYRVISYQRTCGPSASCETFDPPSVRCSDGFEVVDHRPVDVLVTVNPRRATCEIETGFIEVG
jgi:hypothetical protein